MELSLADFPSEILAEITFRLHGFHILRMLYLTGCGVLWRKLQQCGVRHLELSDAVIEESDIRKISTFQGLLSLNVMGDDMPYSTISSLLSVLPIHLTRLHLIDYSRELAWIRDSLTSFYEEPIYRADASTDLYHPDVLTLSDCFPHLQDLNLRGVNLLRDSATNTDWTHEMTISFLHMLPRNLTSLHMYNLRDSEVAYRPHVPPHLTKLTTTIFGDQLKYPVEPLPDTLHASLLDFSEIKIPKNDIIPTLPPNLTALGCTGYWDRFFRLPAPVLPSGLTSLTVTYGRTWIVTVFDDESAKLLPLTLKTLHFENQYSTCSDAAQWPPHLTDFKLLAGNRFVHGINLPKSLKRLHLARTGGSHGFDLQTLPPSLEYLNIDITILSDAEMQQLPKSITSLETTLAPKHLITQWPPRLQSLHVLVSPRGSYWNEEMMRALPNTVTHLEISSLPDYIVPHIPSSVTHLQMKDVEITGRIPMNYDPQTPSDTLKIPSCLYLDPSRLRAISNGSSSPSFDPTTCQPFKLTRNMALHAHLPSGTIKFRTIVRLALIPPSITALESKEPIYSEEVDPLSKFVHLKSLEARLYFLTSLSDMAQLTKLETLVLINVNADQLPLQMPPNLTDIEFREMRGEWKARRRLPTTLRRLHIPYIELQVLKPLEQLEILILGNVDVTQLLQTIPHSVTHLSLNLIKSSELLPLIEVLPHLKILESSFSLKQAELDAFCALGRTIELRGTVSLEEVL